MGIARLRERIQGHPSTEEELGIMRDNRLEENVCGHTDFGSLAPLVLQPITGLQAAVED